MSPETKIITHSVEEISELDLQRADSKLLALWVDDFEEKCVLPIHNKPAFLSTLLEAKKSSKPVIFLAIACLDWQPALDGQDPSIDRVITPVFSDNKRAARVAEGFLQLHRALNSFGINCSVAFTFSDVEAIMTANLANMGQRLFNADLERDIEICINSIIRQPGLKGVDITVFRHLEMLKRATSETDLTQLQKILAGKNDLNFHEFLLGLYKFDLTILPRLIAKENPVVWLNLISKSFMDHILEIEELAKLQNRFLSIVTPFENAGSWSSAPTRQEEFLNKKSFISNRLGVDATLDNGPWSRAILGVRDDKVSNLLQGLGVNLHVASAKDKVKAVNIICQLATGKQLETEIKVIIDADINLIPFLARELQVKEEQIIRLLKSNGIRLNGSVFNDRNFHLTKGFRGTFEVGRKIRLIINE